MQPEKRRLGRLSLASILLVMASLGIWEGREYLPYRDIGGVLSVCEGITDPDDVEAGRLYSDAECDALLRKNVELHDKGIETCVAAVPLMPYEREAYVHFAYNVGVYNFCQSTLVRKLKARDYSGACAELSRWVYVKGKFVRGLANRRAHERKWCEGKL